jgi:hypothetical protein
MCQGLVVAQCRLAPTFVEIVDHGRGGSDGRVAAFRMKTTVTAFASTSVWLRSKAFRRLTRPAPVF